jgi:hypothetical protein
MAAMAIALLATPPPPPLLPWALISEAERCAGGNQANFEPTAEVLKLYHLTPQQTYGNVAHLLTLHPETDDFCDWLVTYGGCAIFVNLYGCSSPFPTHPCDAELNMGDYGITVAMMCPVTCGEDFYQMWPGLPWWIADPFVSINGRIFCEDGALKLPLSPIAKLATEETAARRGFSVGLADAALPVLCAVALTAALAGVVMARRGRRQLRQRVGAEPTALLL